MIPAALILLSPLWSWTGSGPGWGNAGLTGVTIIGLGLLGLWRARKLYSVARRLQGVQILPIAAANAGLVRVRGRVRCDRLLKSPLTQTACCYHRVEIEDESESGGNVPWAPIHREASNADFILDDATGTIRVHPEGLGFEGGFAYQYDLASGSKDAYQQALRDYVARRCPNPLNTLLFKTAKKLFLKTEQTADPQVQQGLQQLHERVAKRRRREIEGRCYRVREYYLLPGQECEIAGTLRVEAGRQKVLSMGSEGMPYLLSLNTFADMGLEQQRKAFGCAAASTVCALIGVAVLVFHP